MGHYDVQCSVCKKWNDDCKCPTPTNDDSDEWAITSGYRLVKSGLRCVRLDYMVQKNKCS